MTEVILSAEHCIKYTACTSTIQNKVLLDYYTESDMEKLTIRM